MLNSIHFLLYYIGISHPITETTIREQDCLKKYAENRKTIAEIGVSQAANTRKFREVMDEDGVLIAIDPYPRFCFGLRGYGWSRIIAHREVGKVRRGKVLWIEDLGENAPALREVRELLPVDFIFIDGDHSYEGLKGDWEAWKEHITLGGIVALHDSRNRNNYGSEKFTNEVILNDKNFTIVDVVDSLTVLEKVVL